MNFSFFELCLPDDDPVYTLKKVMEELDFSGLLANCSDKGRTGYNPIMMYAVVTYANMRGIRAVDRIVELCERDLAFICQIFLEFQDLQRRTAIDLDDCMIRQLFMFCQFSFPVLFNDGSYFVHPFDHKHMCMGNIIFHTIFIFINQGVIFLI